MNEHDSVVNSTLDVEAAERHRADAERLAQYASDEREADVRLIMSLQAGRRFIFDLLVFSGLWRSSYLGGNRDDMMFREGGRNVGLRLRDQLLAVCPDFYRKMQEENAR